ncbi:MAG: dihydrolipoyl dehydrogenase [Clostridia bacterium]|nr:dihydrolipoyl dehydrogenase [Clostridia bacterium]
MVYDLIIIGGGPAGYTAAERAGEAKKKVLLIEKASLGGVCLNEGCIPTKTLLYSAKLKNHAENAKKYGVDIEAASISLNHKKVMARKNKTVKKLIAGIKMRLDGFGVEMISATAEIRSKSNDGFEIAAGDTVYNGKNILVATGSSTVIIPIDGMSEAIDSGFAITSREALELGEIPEKLVVIGGGVIGLEMASYFQSAGSSVKVIEMLDKIAGATDNEIAEILKKECEKKGIEFVLGAKVTKVSQGEVSYTKENNEYSAECSKVLLSVGRRPNIGGLGLENIGVNTEKSILVDEFMKTNIDGVYAAGDVTGKSMLAHTAYRQAEAAVNNMLGIDDKINYSTIPSVIYTDPESASVGVTLNQALGDGLKAKEKTISMNYSGRYMAENEAGQGIAKIVYEEDTRVLLGVHLLGSYASEIIYGAGIMIEQGFTLDDIKRQVFPHPTVAEIIREAVFSIESEGEEP